MSTQLFSNNVSTYVTAAVTAVDTVIYVDSVTGFPTISGDQFFLLTLGELSGGEEVAREIVKVSANPTGTAVTITRAQEGTTARTFAIGSTVELRATAGTYEGLRDSVPTHDALSTAHGMTTVGRAVLQATDAAAARTAIGAPSTAVATTSADGLMSATDKTLFDATYTFPAMRPSLILDFANSGTVDPRVTFSRASTATYYDAYGVLKTALSGVPRIDYCPQTAGCRGLLIEEARTNRVLYSAQLDNASWTATRVVVTANAAVAPDGNTVADAVVPTTDTGTHTMSSTATTISASTTYTGSIFVKPNGYTRVRIRLGDSVGFMGDVVYDCSTASVVSGTGTATVHTLKNGWFRIACTAATAAGATTLTMQVWVYSGGTPTFAGDGTSGVYLWGAQIEAGAFMSSYIATTSAAVTRALDAAQITGTNFSSWYRNDEGTLVVEAESFAGADVDNVCATLSDGTNSNVIALIGNQGSLYSVAALMTTAATAQLTGLSTPTNSYMQLGTKYKAAVGYKSNDVVFASGLGSTLVTDASATIPTVSQLNIGAYYVTSDRTLNGHVARIAFYPYKLTSAEIVSGVM